MTASWRGEAELCTYAAEAASEFWLCHRPVNARDGLDDDSPEAGSGAQAVVKDTVMHEIGHTSAQHNFRASNSCVGTEAQATRPTPTYGITKPGDGPQR